MTVIHAIRYQLLKKDLDNPPENSVSFDIILELLTNSDNTGEIVDIQKKFKPTIVK